MSDFQITMGLGPVADCLAIHRRIERLISPCVLLAADGPNLLNRATGFTRRPGPGYGPAMMRTVGQTGPGIRSFA